LSSHLESGLLGYTIKIDTQNFTQTNTPGSPAGGPYFTVGNQIATDFQLSFELTVDDPVINRISLLDTVDLNNPIVVSVYNKSEGTPFDTTSYEGN
jgi:hypothetical protein